MDYAWRQGLKVVAAVADADAVGCVKEYAADGAG